MDLKKLAAVITDERFYHSPSGNIAIAAESDRGRIINSAAIRRLQQKTQVFPLERNAAVRSRLTHSLEVQQNGRFIVREIEKRLLRSITNQADYYHYSSLFRSIESFVEMACLMHDIGNPPFGHFGESAINGWFTQHLPGIFENLEDDSSNSVSKADLLRELAQFEGNAQAIRLVHSLMSLNLTYTQIAAVFKYTRLATQPKPKKDAELSYLRKKPGYYWSESAIVDRLYQQLDMPQGHRHPLSYIMEAADDISYGLADIEDAVEKGVLSLTDVVDGLKKVYAEDGGDINEQSLIDIKNEKRSLESILNKAESKYKDKQGNDDPKVIDKVSQFFIALRVSIHTILVPHAAQRFVDNYDAVVSGSFNQALLEDGSDMHRLCKALKTLAGQRVFCHPEVEQKELRGHTIIKGLLDIYAPLLRLPQDDFWQLSEGDSDTCRAHPLCSRLFNKLSNKHIRAYKSAVKENDDNPLLERYFRCRLLQDYVSGMTDQFAYDEYRSLTVSD